MFCFGLFGQVIQQILLGTLQASAAYRLMIQHHDGVRLRAALAAKDIRPIELQLSPILTHHVHLFPFSLSIHRLGEDRITTPERESHPSGTGPAGLLAVGRPDKVSGLKLSAVLLQVQQLRGLAVKRPAPQRHAVLALLDNQFQHPVAIVAVGRPAAYQTSSGYSWCKVK